MRPFKDGHLVSPDTGDVVYTEEEVAFLKAVERFKMANNRKFPTLREILLVAKSLGYEKTGEAKEPPRMSLNRRKDRPTKWG
jgi:hypothetical protein